VHSVQTSSSNSTPIGRSPESVARAVGADFQEALRQGGSAIRREMRSFGNGSLNTGDLSIPVRAWHGTRDENTPLTGAITRAGRRRHTVSVRNRSPRNASRPAPGYRRVVRTGVAGVRNRRGPQSPCMVGRIRRPGLRVPTSGVPGVVATFPVKSQPVRARRRSSRSSLHTNDYVSNSRPVISNLVPPSDPSVTRTSHP